MLALMRMKACAAVRTVPTTEDAPMTVLRAAVPMFETIPRSLDAISITTARSLRKRFDEAASATSVGCSPTKSGSVKATLVSAERVVVRPSSEIPLCRPQPIATSINPAIRPRLPGVTMVRLLVGRDCMQAKRGFAPANEPGQIWWRVATARQPRKWWTPVNRWGGERRLGLAAAERIDGGIDAGHNSRARAQRQVHALDGAVRHQDPDPRRVSLAHAGEDLGDEAYVRAGDGSEIVATLATRFALHAPLRIRQRRGQHRRRRAGRADCPDSEGDERLSGHLEIAAGCNAAHTAGTGYRVACVACASRTTAARSGSTAGAARAARRVEAAVALSLIHISEPTRQAEISY